MIIETSDNRFLQVREPESAELAHCWWGFEVKRVRGQWVPKTHAVERLVRKAATRVVES